MTLKGSDIHPRDHVQEKRSNPSGPGHFNPDSHGLHPRLFMVQPAGLAAHCSGIGLIGLRIEQAHSRNLPGIHQIPMNADPNNKELGATFRRDGEVFRMLDRQRFTICQMQPEGTERGSITHVLKVGDFHSCDSMINGIRQVFNCRLWNLR